MVNVLGIGDISDVVGDALETVGEGRAGHDCYGGAGWFLEEEFDEMLA